MEMNILIAGVGGQGILTIAQAISQTALDRGFHVKQSEVHGMSQRGGSVQAHLRYADHPLHSDLIPHGLADLVIAVEPLEALRYGEYCNDRTIYVVSNVQVQNIPDYPNLEEILGRIDRLGTHVLIDSRSLAVQAGSARAENMIMLGAASPYLDLPFEILLKWVRQSFEGKGSRVVESNVRALRMGRKAADLFQASIGRGRSSSQTRSWMSTLPRDRFESDETTFSEFSEARINDTLTIDALNAIKCVLQGARDNHRRQLFEHEVYRMVEAAGAISPPVHLFVPCGQYPCKENLNAFSGDRVVLKVVSSEIVHKSDSGGVVFLPLNVEAVSRGIESLVAKYESQGSVVAGTLLVEFIDHDAGGLGGELFVGLRHTREFGPVIAAGLGGVDTEYLAEKLRPGASVAKAAVMETTADDFFREFQKTAAYELLSGRVRGHECEVRDGELIRCFAAFIAIAREFATPTANEPALEELEVNPFAFRRRQLVPLDGRGRLGIVHAPPLTRPVGLINRLLEPRSIAVAGVSSKRANLGRVILNNIQYCGFSNEHLYVIKNGDDRIDGVRCVPDLASLPEQVDLLVAATPAESVSDLIDQALPTGNCPAPCKSIVLIPGGMGEKEGTQELHREIQDRIRSSRAKHPETPVILGGNCLGVRSRPGHYDTFFIPEAKLDPRRQVPAKRCALISQSGGFLISRMSHLEFLDPALAISIGNQIDLTAADMFAAVSRRADIDCIGVYVEGFNDLDGLAFVRAAKRAIAAGKAIIFYKAGRTDVGQSAAQGHTASLAGDYDVCLAAVSATGAIVADTFTEFQQLMELATALHGKAVDGKRVGAVTNAGYEAVGMADAITGTRYQLSMPVLSADTVRCLKAVLTEQQIDHLVDAKNPLDLTPMASDKAYEEAVRVMLDSDDVDAVVVGCVPMTPSLLTTPIELQNASSLAHRIPRLFSTSRKPLICVIDCAGPYEQLAQVIRQAGVPMFRSADQAIRSLGRYLSYRQERAVHASKRVVETDREKVPKCSLAPVPVG